MTSTPQTDMQNHLDDPRSRSDFRPQYYPKANGEAAPPIDSVGRNERITLEFLAAYYDLNCQYSRLLEMRASAGSPERNRAEQESLLTVERLLIIRDQLEDRYAPLAVIAEPVVQGGFTIDLGLSFGNVDATGR